MAEVMAIRWFEGMAVWAVIQLGELFMYIDINVQGLESSFGQTRTEVASTQSSVKCESKLALISDNSVVVSIRRDALTYFLGSERKAMATHSTLIPLLNHPH